MPPVEPRQQRRVVNARDVADDVETVTSHTAPSTAAAVEEELACAAAASPAEPATFAAPASSAARRHGESCSQYYDAATGLLAQQRRCLGSRLVSRTATCVPVCPVRFLIHVHSTLCSQQCGSNDASGRKGRAAEFQFTSKQRGIERDAESDSESTSTGL